jgi:hypothetical protein
VDSRHIGSRLGGRRARPGARLVSGGAGQLLRAGELRRWGESDRPLDRRRQRRPVRHDKSPDSGYVSDAPFASLSGVLCITGGQHPAFTLDARFGLAAGGSGIDPPSEPVRLQVGPYAGIDPGRFFPAATRRQVFERLCLRRRNRQCVALPRHRLFRRQFVPLRRRRDAARSRREPDAGIGARIVAHWL